MNQRENGLLMCAVIAFSGVIWLFNIRAIAPRLMTPMRWIVLIVFWGTAVLLLMIRANREAVCTSCRLNVNTDQMAS
jgi:hypothetical protein